MNRAYAVLDVKSIDDDKRTITGIATTTAVDRQDDIVESEGAEFKLPIPLLWQHDSEQPIGQVTAAKVTASGITVTAQFAKTDEPGTLKDRLDESWQSVKLGLVRGLSIGFKPIETARIEGTYGVRFLKWLWLELSAVTIAANQEATIQTLKSIDAPLLAATGKQQKDSDRPTPPAPGKTKSIPVVKAQEGKVMKKTIAEQIASFEATRQAKSAEMDAIMETSAESGETLDAEQTEKYDGLAAEVKSIDAHLVRLRDHEKTNKSAATVVTDVRTNDEASNLRGGKTSNVVVLSPKKLEPGIGFTRFVMATALAKGNPMQALEIFKGRERWMAETPQIADILKTAVTAGSTSDSAWGGPLVNYQILSDEFIEYLRPLTIIGRIPGLTHVPFKVKIPRQTGGATVNWVGEGAPKPLTSLAFDSVTLDFAKIAGIIVLNQELIRLATPSAELLVRNDLAAAVVQFMDSQFVDPSKAAVAGVSPASITNGVTPVTASGTTGAAFRADMKTLLSTFLTANMQVTGVVILMSQHTALGISLMTNTLGQREFPDLTMNGGALMGIPVITSENIPSTGGSPTDGDPIIIISAKDILLADDGQVSIDASDQASLQMDTAPDSPATASTTFVSLWQQNQIALRAERYINWAKRRSTAVQYLQNAKYFE